MNRRRMLHAGAATAAAVLTYTAIGEPTASAAENDRSPLPPVREGCACNLTDEHLYVYITSGWGGAEGYLRPGQCWAFRYYDDQSERVLSAFSGPNELVTHFAFVPVADACLVIEQDAREPKMRREKPKERSSTFPI